LLPSCDALSATRHAALYQGRWRVISRLLDRWFKDKPTPEAFAAKVIQTARQLGIDKRLEYQADQFRIAYDGGSFFNLHNAYTAYLEVERGRQREVLERFTSILGMANEEEPPFVEIRDRLRPVIHNRNLLDQIILQEMEVNGLDAQISLQYRPLTGECVELLAVDYEQHTATQTRDLPEEWGVDLDQALAIARDNLRTLDDAPFVEIAPGLFRSTWGDAYDSSRVLLPELLHRLPLAGMPVFMLPTRDVLLVASERDEQAQRAMIAQASEAMNDGRVISDEMLHYVEGQLQTVIPASEVLRQALRALHLQVRAGLYATQKEQLDKVHELHGHDVFVANFIVDSSNHISIGCWSEGVDTSLPQTDFIALVVEESDTQMVEWHVVMREFGHLLEADTRHIHPPRYLTRGFPDADLRARCPGDTSRDIGAAGQGQPAPDTIAPCRPN